MQPRIITGTLLTIAGLACYGAATAVLFQALDRQDRDYAQIQRAERSCREQLVQLGRMTPRPNDVIEIEITNKDDPNGLSDPRAALADVTAALAMCPGRTLIDACIGTGCDDGVPTPNRMTFRLGVLK